MDKKCPCCSGLPYENCCKPYHDGTNAPTALALMRSRYSAYALEKAGYIMQTTHSRSPYFEKNRNAWERSILEFCKTTKFLHLKILETGENTVEFSAHLKQGDREFFLEEKSYFLKIDGKWLYLKGEVKT